MFSIWNATWSPLCPLLAPFWSSLLRRLGAILNPSCVSLEPSQPPLDSSWVLLVAHVSISRAIMETSWPFWPIWGPFEDRSEAILIP